MYEALKSGALNIPKLLGLTTPEVPYVPVAFSLSKYFIKPFNQTNLARKNLPLLSKQS